MNDRTFHPSSALPLALAFLLPTGAAAAIPPTDDAYVSANQPANKFGGVSTLNVGNGSRSLLKFDVSAVPAGTDPEQVVKATLRLWINKLDTAGPIQVTEISSSWSEASVTHTGMPTTTSASVGSFVATAARQWVAIDLTATVKAWLSGAATNYGVLLEPEAGSRVSAFFDSKENTGTSHPAQLDIVLAGPRGAQGDAGPAGPQGARGAIGPQGAQGPAGATGPLGPQGPRGAPGHAVLTGDGAPAAGLGEDGDFYLDRAQSELYGPKALGAWPGKVSLKGLQGAAGAQGPKGDTGPTGLQGPKGDLGPTGPQGSKGDTGTTGPQGTKGIAGGTGPQGPKGAIGATGPQGPAGIAGGQGPTGPQGPTGTTGPAGPAGAIGPQGSTGPVGPQGAIGPTGPQGPKPSAAYALVVGKSASDSTGRSNLATPDFSTVTAALNAVPANLYSGGVCSARYIVTVLPGTYSESVAMKPCVDIEGSGELNTFIESNGTATVTGANDAELRFLTVRNTAVAGYAVYNSLASPRLTQITALAANTGIRDENSASPVLTNVTAKAAVAVDHRSGAMLIQQSVLEGTSSSVIASGGTARLFASQIKGPAASGQVTCAASYDGAYAALGSDCTLDRPALVDILFSVSSSDSTYNSVGDTDQAYWPGGQQTQSLYGYEVVLRQPSGSVDVNVSETVTGWKIVSETFPGNCEIIRFNDPDCSGLGADSPLAQKWSRGSLYADSTGQIANYPSCVDGYRAREGQGHATATALVRCALK